MAESHSNLWDNSARLRKNVSKLAFRSKEKVMRSIGRAEETKDEILDHYIMLINKQQTKMLTLQRDMKHYLQALKAMSTSQKAFYNSLYEIYDDDWAGKDVVATCCRRSELLYDDVFARFHTEVLEPLQTHIMEYQQCKVRVEKRGRKLVDYDAARRLLQSLETAKKPDGMKIDRARESDQQAREMYEELNNSLHEQLPTLYDSRLPVSVNIFSSICESEKIFSSEMAELRSNLNSVLLSLKSAYDSEEYRIQRMQPPPLDNGKTTPGRNNSVGRSAGRMSTPSTVSYTTPEKSSKHGPLPPPRSSDSGVRVSPISDPSTHEYVNLQVGPISKSVKPASVEEKNDVNNESTKKQRPVSMHVPAAVAGLSVHEVDKRMTQDDGSGSADQKTLPTIGDEASERDEQHRSGGRSLKSILGMLGIKWMPKSTKASTPALASELASAAKQDHCMVVEEILGPETIISAGASNPTDAIAVVAEEIDKGTSSSALENTVLVTDQKSSTSCEISASSDAKLELENFHESKKDNGQTYTEGATKEDISLKSAESHREKTSRDLAPVKYAAAHNDNNEVPRFHEVQIKTEHVETKEQQLEAESAEENQHSDAAQEAVQVDAEIRRLSLENDPVFSEAVRPGQDFSETFRSTNSVSSLNRSSIDEDLAFGTHNTALVGASVSEGFSDSFVPHGADNVSAGNAFDSECLQTVRENGYSGDDSVFHERAQTESIGGSKDDLNIKHLFVSEEGSRLVKQHLQEDADFLKSKFQCLSAETVVEAVTKSGDISELLNAATEKERPSPQSAVVALPVCRTAGHDPLQDEGGEILPARMATSTEFSVDAPGLPSCDTPASVKVEVSRSPIEVLVNPVGLVENSERKMPLEGVIVASLSPRLDEHANMLLSQLQRADDTIKDAKQGALPMDNLEECCNVSEANTMLHKCITTTLPRDAAPSIVNFAIDEDDNATLDPKLSDSPTALANCLEELPKPSTTSATANGNSAAVEPIYEEPPREELLSRTSSPPKSPNKSIDSHKYLDLPPDYLFSVQAMYQYRGSDDDELSFDKGEILHIVKHPDPEEQDDGWQMGVRQKDWERGEDFNLCMGLFPENFTKRLQL